MKAEMSIDQMKQWEEALIESILRANCGSNKIRVVDLVESWLQTRAKIKKKFSRHGSNPSS